MSPRRVVVWGAGAWGTALALHLDRLGNEVHLWVFEPSQYDAMVAQRANPDFLPGHALPASIRIFRDLQEAPGGAGVWLSASPAQTVRALWDAIGPACPPEALVISASKGIERGSLVTPCAIIDSMDSAMRAVACNLDDANGAPWRW